LKKIIKNLLFGKHNIQKIRGGIGKGLRMKIDVSNKAQRIIGLDEYEVQKIFKEFALKAEYFFDIGASDGYYSLLFRKYNFYGIIYMFEVQSRFKEEIFSNFSSNNYSIDYHYFAKFASNKIDENNITIDSIFSGKDDLLLFKIDVDGGEETVLKGMEITVKNNKCFFIIETHSKELEESCIAFMVKNEYSYKIVDHAWFRSILPEERILKHNRWLIAFR
jgi:hypothetical protein